MMYAFKGSYVVYPFIHRIDLWLEMLGEESSAGSIDLAELFWEELVELGVQHANDLARLVVHDGFGLLVPQCWNGISSFVMRISLQVELFQRVETVERILLHGSAHAGEEPPIRGEFETCRYQLDDAIIHAFQSAY